MLLKKKTILKKLFYNNYTYTWLEKILRSFNKSEMHRIKFILTYDTEHTINVLCLLNPKSQKENFGNKMCHILAENLQWFIDMIYFI